MPGRKLLFILRRPMTVGQTEDVFLDGRSFTPEDDVSVVLLNAAVADERRFAGRTFFLREDAPSNRVPPNSAPISYAELIELIFEADSTVVV